MIPDLAESCRVPKKITISRAYIIINCEEVSICLSPLSPISGWRLLRII